MADLKASFELPGAKSQITVEWTARLAGVLHKGQTDHSGHPYILHPGRVVANVLRLDPNADAEILMAAWLHDTMEDCGVTAEQLKDWGYSESVIAMIEAVTKPANDTRPYAQVIADLIATGNRGAMLIKLADNMDNLHPARTAQLRAQQPEKAARLAARYVESVKALAGALGLQAQDVLNTIAASPPLEAPAPDPA